MDNFKDIFEKNCIIEKDGKKYLNELGAIVIAFATISILKKIFSEVSINDNNKKEN